MTRLEEMARAASAEAVARANGVPAPAPQFPPPRMPRSPGPCWFNATVEDVPVIVPPETPDEAPTAQIARRVMLEVFHLCGEATVYLEPEGADALAKLLTERAAEARSGLTIVRQ